MPEPVRAAIADFVAEHHVEHRSSSASATAPIPRRWRGARHRRIANERCRKIREENFLRRWSRRKRAAETRAPDATEPAPGIVQTADANERLHAPRYKAKADLPAFDPADPAADRIDHCDERHPRISCTRRSRGAHACGSSTRMA